MWRKRYCSKNVTANSVLNGKYGDSNILSEFTDFYKENIAQPNSPGIDSKLSQDVKALLDVRLNDHINDVPVVALGDIEQCIRNLKHNKAGGYDGVVNEHLIFSDHQLRVHLSLLFAAMLRHSFVPDDFCRGIIVPLLKSKHGDASSLDMYRGITLSPVLSKVFEAVLLRIYKDYLISDLPNIGGALCSTPQSLADAHY